MITAVIDTSALFPDCTLTGVRAQMLLRWSGRGSYDFAIPEVVVLELVHDARERLQTAKQRVEKAERICAELEVDANASSINVDAGIEQVEKNLRNRIRQAGGTIPPIPTPEHRELVDRSIRGQKPFNRPSQGSREASDRGYRDTLIWISARELAAAGRRVVLVTKNTGDFAHEGQLHPDLVRDVTQASGGLVELCLSLDEFLKDHLPVDADVLEAIQELLADDEAFRDAAREFVRPSLKDAAIDRRSRVDFARAANTSDDSSYSPEAVTISDNKILSVQAVDAYGFDDDSVGAIELKITAELTADLVFARPDAEWLAHLGSEVEFEDWDSIETAVAGYTTVKVVATGDLLLDKGSHTLVDFDVVAVSNVAGDDP